MPEYGDIMVFLPCHVLVAYFMHLGRCHSSLALLIPLQWDLHNTHLEQRWPCRYVNYMFTCPQIWADNELWYFIILLLITLHFISEWTPRFHWAFCPNIITCVGNKWYKREFIPGGKDELPRKTVLRMAFGEERYQYVLRLLLSVILIY